MLHLRLNKPLRRYQHRLLKPLPHRLRHQSYLLLSIRHSPNRTILGLVMLILLKLLSQYRSVRT
jgi:hypothetical protein